ncbi:acyl-CoA dehydrogenase family protein [Algiphilus sp.]|uniref:acyl-CoA dehydrogenase family protein n=1 Tax=Algiphilus sp. TaxID=1872431 RepID=UPI003C65C737
MELSLSEDERMIRDAAADFLDGVSDSAAVRACIEAEDGVDHDAWRRIAGELGWCAVGIDEAHGGMGMGALTEALLFEQAGRHLLCAPLFATLALGANLLRSVADDGARERWLPGVAEGRVGLSAPLPATADWTDAAENLEARSDDAGWHLRGDVARVPDAAAVDTLLLFARLPGDDGIGLFAVPSAAEGVTVRTRAGWDATRRFAEVALRDVAAERVDDAGRLRSELPRATALARLAIAAETLGAAQQCLDLTTAYVAERKQFGRAVGSFQAVKHRCAEMMVAIEALRSGVHGAARLAETGTDTAALAAECAALRARADTTGFFCAQEAIQLHGGVGFTWEYDPHLYFKRMQAAHHWLGTPEALRAEVAAHLFRAEAA